MPSTSADRPAALGTEKQDEVERRARRSSARKGKRPPRREGTPSQPGSASTTPPVVGEDRRGQYESELDDVSQAYPGAHVWERNTGFWLETCSKLLSGCARSAVIVTAIPAAPHAPRSWGFWSSAAWIGPRHTNYPDGSICSYEPNDGTWYPGHSLVTLLDLHTLWVLRHLHLALYGRWPGRQAVHNAFERHRELHPDELCGCDSLIDKTYGECCQARDKASNLVAAAVRFNIATKGGVRQPPGFLRRYLGAGQRALPEPATLFE